MFIAKQLRFQNFKFVLFVDCLISGSSSLWSESGNDEL